MSVQLRNCMCMFVGASKLMLTNLNCKFLLFIWAALIREGVSLTCYSRSAETPYSFNDGALVKCPTSSTGLVACYAYSNLNGVQFAGCTSTGCTDFAYKSCVICRTNKCNRIITFSIRCYSRPKSNYISDGTMTLCPTGVTSCYSLTPSGEAGCGSCSGAPTCSSCNKDLCNSQLQCYYRSGSTSGSNGYSTVCSSSASSAVCYAYVNSYGKSYAGCSDSGFCKTLVSKSCITCTTDYCNTVRSVPDNPLETTALIPTQQTPLFIKCYSRASLSDLQSLMTCEMGVKLCYSINSSGEAGCGSCSIASDCTTCTRDFCNFHLPINKPLQCFYSMGSRRRGVVSCTDSCFSYSYSYAFLYFYYNGCGSCKDFGHNCRTCTTDYCNTSVSSSTAAFPFIAFGTLVVMLLY